MDFIIDACDTEETIGTNRWIEFNAFKTTLRESRFNGAPETLQHFAVRCIVEKRARFISQKPAPFVDYLKENDFSCLSNTVVQELVQALAQEKRSNTQDVSKFFFLLHLLNKRVTEFCFSHLNLSEVHQSGEAAVFNHLLHHCPKIEKIELTNDVWENYVVVPRLRLDHIFPMMFSKWPNLSYINVSNLKSGSTGDNQSILQTVCDHFPGLRGLEVSVTLNRFFVTFGITPVKQELLVGDVQKLSKMQHLTHMTLNVDYVSFANDDSIKMIVEAVGMVPNLETLDLNLEDKPRTRVCTTFVHLYKAKFPQKKLYIKRMEVFADLLDNDWPACLSVEELQVFGNTDAPCANFSALKNKVQRLVLTWCSPTQVYTLVEEVGEGLTHLTIVMVEAIPFLNTVIPPLELQRILDSCPELEVIDIETTGRIAGSIGPIGSLKPEHFQRFSKFRVVSKSADQLEDAIEDLYKMFLLGSEQKLKELVVSSKGALKASAWALQQKRSTCMDQLKVLRIHFPELNKDLLRETTKFIFALAQRSCHLREVDVKPQAEEPLRWFSQLLCGAGIHISGM